MTSSTKLVQAYLGLATVVVMLHVALPMSFEFRQLVSVAGLTVTELCLLGACAMLLVAAPAAFAGRQSSFTSGILAMFGLWVVVRAGVGVLEGNEPVRAMRGLRGYLPLVLLPTLTYAGVVAVKDPLRWLGVTVKVLVWAYAVYTVFLLIAVTVPASNDYLGVYPQHYRIRSNTLQISGLMLMLSYVLKRNGRLGTITLAIAIASAATSLLLGQARMGTAMVVLSFVIAAMLYTVRTLRTGFLTIVAAATASTVLFAAAVLIALNVFVTDFGMFTELALQRYEAHQHGRTVTESVVEYSLGFQPYRTRVVQRALVRPVVGYGEGAGVGPTMSQDDGDYIDSTLITMWYKNGIPGVFLYYLFWVAVLAALARGWLRFVSPLEAGIASATMGALIGWLGWSLSDVFLMSGWVLYPILYICAAVIVVLGRPLSGGSRRLPATSAGGTHPAPVLPSALLDPVANGTRGRLTFP